MPKLPRIPSVLAIRALQRAGFRTYHQSGSHVQLRYFDKPNVRVTVPFHRKDLALKTLKSIIKQADLTVDEFVSLL
jgi:predicted RNA binding protein YcfA (HicA-like mRNA interferase family)